MDLSIGAWTGLPVEAVTVWIAVTYGATIVYEIVKAWQASAEVRGMRSSAMQSTQIDLPRSKELVNRRCHLGFNIEPGEKSMLKLAAVTFLSVVVTIPALADQKLEGDTTLRDSQPAGVPNKHDKHMKHQVFDLTFDGAGNQYVCRTDGDKTMNPTDFVVGSGIHYQVNGKKVKITTPNNKKVECKVVRVAVAAASQ